MPVKPLHVTTIPPKKRTRLNLHEITLTTLVMQINFSNTNCITNLVYFEYGNISTFLWVLIVLNVAKYWF